MPIRLVDKKAQITFDVDGTPVTVMSLTGGDRAKIAYAYNALYVDPKNNTINVKKDDFSAAYDEVLKAAAPFIVSIGEFKADSCDILEVLRNIESSIHQMGIINKMVEGSSLSETEQKN